MESVTVRTMTKKASVKWASGPRGVGRYIKNGTGAWNDLPWLPLRGHVVTELCQLRLVAAALANSFSLALSKELKLNSLAVAETTTTSSITLERSGNKWVTQKIQLSVCAKIPRLAQGQFIDATLRAKTRCLLSSLLRGNISMNARLES